MPIIPLEESILNKTNNFEETIINLFLIIEKDSIVQFKALSHKVSGSDEEKIAFLKSKVEGDFQIAEEFESPQNEKGEFITYKDFEKFEKAGLHFNFFEGIFRTYEVGSEPLICVTPVVEGKILN